MTNKELADKLNDIWEDLKPDDIRVPYSAFLSHRKKSKPESLSASTIYNKFIELCNSNNQASQKDLEFYHKCLIAFKQFEAWFPVFQNSVDLAIEKKSDTKQENTFYDKTWCAYFFDNRQREKVKLAQVIVKIDKLGVVRINNIKDQRSEEYEGTFRLHEKKYLIFELSGMNRQDRPLYLEIMTGPIPTEISIGSYITIEQDTIVSGTILFKLLDPEERDKFESGLYSYMEDKDKFLNIDKRIRAFLCKKSFNYNKLPRDIYSLKDLETLHTDYIRKKKSLFFDLEKPIVFISSPAHSISEKTFLKNKELILELKSKLNDKVGDLKILYPGEGKEFEIRISRFVKNLKTLSRTHFFVYIQLNDDEDNKNKRPSTSLIELGWALAFCKNVLVFYEDKDAVPSIVPLLGSTSQLNDYKDHQLPAENKLEFIYEAIINEINLALKLGLEEVD